MTFAENIIFRRKELGLSAEKLSKLIGISRSYVTLIENGKRLPGKNLLVSISKALNLSRETVIGWYMSDIEKQVS